VQSDRECQLTDCLPGQLLADNVCRATICLGRPYTSECVELHVPHTQLNRRPPQLQRRLCGECLVTTARTSYTNSPLSRLDERRCSSHFDEEVAQIHWPSDLSFSGGPNSTLHGHRTQQVPLLRLKTGFSQPELQPLFSLRTVEDTGGSPLHCIDRRSATNMQEFFRTGA